MNSAAQPMIKTADTVAEAAEKLAAKPSLIGLSREELLAVTASLGLPAFRAKQLWHWMYHHGVTDFSAMHTINKATQAQLAESFSIARAGVSRNLISLDETQKWLLKFADGNEVETVFIPEAPRGTLCISSQVGCTLSCTFCHTGTQRLVRNLTASEIVTQFLVARDGLAGAAQNSHEPARAAHRTSEAISEAKQTRISNVVFMGMGEPLFNFEHVVKACNILTDPDGIGLSKRKVTVSTSGVVPKMRELGEKTQVNLAVSLHAVHDDLRNEIVPINRKYPIAELLAACRDYVKIVPNRRIMFEYVMLNGVNDSEADAHALVKLLKDIPSKVNLIPFNPWPGAPYTCSSNNRIHAFGRVLIAAGITTPIRKTRGEDIMAACGQLKSLSELKKGQKVKLD
jgi:23S rRNA (adenine2503-C2)-methyltransferase